MTKINNKTGLRFFVAISFLCLSLGVMLPAQAQSNGVGGLLDQSKASLTDLSELRNSTGSCDSTCDAMGTAAPTSSMQSAFLTRVQSCGAGYTGIKTQSRIQNADGSLTPWVDAETSQCVCVPTFENRPGVCSAPKTGGFSTERRNWTCSANVGSWSAFAVVVDSCFVPCAPASPSIQNQTLSCSAGQVGQISQTRSSSCPSGVGSNSTAAWSGWSTTSNTCFTPCAPQATLYQGVSCPASYSGAKYQYNISYCPGGAGANSSPYYGGWVTYSDQCYHAAGKPLGAPFCQGDMYEGGQVMSLMRNISNGAGGSYAVVVVAAGCTPGPQYAESGPYGTPIGGQWYAGSPYYWTPADNDMY